MKIPAFVIVLIWFLIKWWWFGTAESMKQLSPTSQRLVNQTTQTIAAAYDYSAEAVGEFGRELAESVESVTSSTVASYRDVNRYTSSRYAEYVRFFDDTMTTTSLAFDDMKKGTGSALSRLRKAYHQARQRFE